jgi:hypothetical protein
MSRRGWTGQREAMEEAMLGKMGGMHKEMNNGRGIEKNERISINQ